MNIPKDGSKWCGADSRKIFCVIYTKEIEDHMWIYYREQDTGTEYSCYMESFLLRFTECPE